MTTVSRFALTDTWLLEVFLGLYTLVWGVGFANPWLVAFAPGNPSYAILSQFPGGELAFGMFAGALGLAKLWASAYAARRTRGLVCAGLGAFWIFVVISVGIPTHWTAGGLPHFALAAAANWFVWVRMSQRVVP